MCVGNIGGTFLYSLRRVGADLAVKLTLIRIITVVIFSKGFTLVE